MKNNDKNRKMYRQGDVLIVSVDKMPTGLTEVKRTERGIVLAEGEVTGHAHRIPSRHANLYRSESDARFLRVMGPAPIAKTVHVPAAPALDEDGNQIVDDLGNLSMTPAHDREVMVAAKGGVELLHEEHDRFPIPPGNYQIVIHHEYEPGAIRRVED